MPHCSERNEMVSVERCSKWCWLRSHRKLKQRFETIENCQKLHLRYTMGEAEAIMERRNKQ